MSCNGPGALIRSTSSRGGSEWAETALDRRRHIQVAPPASGHHLGLAQRVEDLAVQQFARTPSATDCPCETRTSTCRSLARASSGRCFLLAISALLRLEAIPRDGPPSVIAGGGSSPCCAVPPHLGGRERGGRRGDIQGGCHGPLRCARRVPRDD